MALKDLKIGTQMSAGMGAILAFVAIFGVVTWQQTARLWEQTQGLHDHPLMVRRALGEIKADILFMHRAVKDLCLAENESERQKSLQDIDTYEANAYRHFDVVFDRYLGPQKDVEEASRTFIEWKAIREETIRLLRAGRVTEAIQRTTPAGAGGHHVDLLMDQIARISDFALARGDQFYADAEALHRAQRVQLGVILGLIVLLSVGLVSLLLRSIRVPLRELTFVIEEFRGGRLDVRSRYASGNEFGVLSGAFNTFAQAMQDDTVVKNGAAQLSIGMLRELESHTFHLQVLEPLVRLTGSQVGAIFVLNEQKTAYEHLKSIGLGAEGRAPFSAREREGEIGAALATGQITRISRIPLDTRFRFAAVSGEFLPREIVTVPLQAGHEIAAVISLASLYEYSPVVLRLLAETQGALAGWMNTMLAHRRVQALTESLEHQNRELESQKKELSAQADELGEQNVELEMQKRELDEANRLKSAFLSNMSHELRTPLNSVIALSGVLSRRLATTIPEAEYGYLEVIGRNGRHLLALINDLLDLSRIEAGREETHEESFSLHELVSEVVAVLEHQAGEKHLRLVSDVDPALPPLRSDRLKCLHILQNLVGNAVKFTETGEVRISARLEGEAVQVAVADTGIGIAARDLPHIFDEFRQADSGAARKYGGTGLGLAIARKYATLLRGKISVHSTPGKGSTFTLELPLTMGGKDIGHLPAEPVKVRIPARSADASLPRAAGGRGILVVEDNEVAVIQITDILTGQGHAVRVARNGREALAQIEQDLPAAVILDLMMPEVDGFQVLRAIRGTEKTVGLPVLILTARHVTREELRFLTGNHIHQLIQKGDISREELLAAVAEMVNPGRVTPPRPRTRPARKPRTDRPVILVVEDDPDNMISMRGLLTEEATLLEATDGRAGVELARQHVPDLILMDIAMPVMDGFEALAVIRGEEALRHIPVLAVTASAMRGSREEILEHGFDGYISKPIDAVELMKTIREVLDGT